MANDITSLLYRIKENIRAIEAGDTRDPVLSEVRSDFLEFIELIKLFLISERDSYYGYFMMNMQFRANFYSKSIAGIKLNEFPAVFEANPLLLCKFSLKEIIYIFCHEIDHVVFNHPAEALKVNPNGNAKIHNYFNLAADAAVNDALDWEIVDKKREFMKSPEGLINSQVLSKEFSLPYLLARENYAYYFRSILGKKPENSDEESNGFSIPLDEDGENAGQFEEGGQDSDDNKDRDDSQDGDNIQSDSQDGDNSQNEDESQDGGNDQSESDGQGGGNSQNGNGSKVITAKNYGGKLDDHNWEAGNDAEDASAAVRELVNSAANMINSDSRGLMPAQFMSQVEKLNQPSKIRWQMILKKYVGTITANKRKTRMRLNRRQPERFDLSGTMDDKVLKIVVAIDTSGSVGDKMISQIFNEIFEILAKRKHDITVIECDAEVQRVYKAKTKDDIKKKVMGRGGTWFSPVIDYVNKDKYFRDALLIYFTDGFGEYEIPKPRTYRNIWVVFDDEKNLSVREPYGIVLSL